MHGPCANVAIQANSALPKTGSKSPRNGEANSSVVEVLKGLLGPKPWTVLCDWFKLSPGAARKKISCERELSANEITKLLQSDHGREVLVALMADAEPKWWRAFKSQMLIVDAKKADYRAQRMLREAIDVRDETEHAISRAETALALSREARDRDGVVTRQSMARVRNRTVAAALRNGGRGR